MLLTPRLQRSSKAQLFQLSQHDDERLEKQSEGRRTSWTSKVCLLYRRIVSHAEYICLIGAYPKEWFCCCNQSGAPKSASTPQLITICGGVLRWRLLAQSPTNHECNVCIYTSTCVHTHIQARIHLHVQTRVQVHVQIHMQMNISMHMHMHHYRCMLVAYTYTYIYIYV